jgi:tRNA-specific 2-thiouridylase
LSQVINRRQKALKDYRNRQTFYTLPNQDQHNLPSAYFAWSDGRGTRLFPIFDAPHCRSAIWAFSRWFVNGRLRANCPYPKEEVRKMADKRGLPHLRNESQDICFLLYDHNEFLRKNLKLKKGKIMTADGKIIGEHEGLPFYTMGQRHGFSKGGGIPYYVVGKNIKKNLLIIASKADEEKFYKKELEIKNVNWISGNAPAGGKSYKARIRYRQELQNCRIKNSKVIFTHAQRAVTPGQSLVVYRGQELIGGGVIK